MDGSAFRHLSFGFVMWLGILAAVGIVASMAGAGFAFWYFVFSHLRWVA